MEFRGVYLIDPRSRVTSPSCANKSQQIAQMAAAARRKNAKTAPVVAFLDTNIFLHFLPFHEVDWRSALSAQTVELRVAATVVKELNKKKDGPGPDHIRDRARKVSRKIREVALLGDGQLGESVRLACDERPPSIDFQGLGLDRDWQDDCILAAVIEYKEQHPDAQVVLVTDDSGAAIRAHTYGVKSAALAENLRIPPEADQKQQRIRELEEKLREVEKGLPRLELTFADGKLHCNFPIKPDTIVTPADAMAFVEAHIAPRYLNQTGDTWRTLAAQAKENDGMSEGIASFMRSMGSIAEFMALKAGNNLALYLQQCRDHLVALQRHNNELARTRELSLVLANVGSIPAEEVNVVLFVPKVVNIYPTGGLPAPPPPPVPPGAPKAAAPAKKPPVLSRIQFVRSRDLGNRWELQYHLARLNHHLTEPLSGLCIHFASYEAAKPFRIEFRLVAVNAPTAITGSLDVVPQIPTGNLVGTPVGTEGVRRIARRSQK